MSDAASGPAPEESRERHVPVLRDRVIALLAPVLERPGAVLVDATLGLGGHAQAALERFASLRLVGIDRDAAALALSAHRLASFGDRVMLVQATYDEIARVLDDLGIARVDAVLFDLGVSSMQLDEAERGFAYAHDAPLDMRMDPRGGITAADVLNTYSAADLARVLREFGDERFAGRIAARVVAERQVEPFGSSERLVTLIREVIPAPARRTGGHPAKRTFQALRIEVNGELEILRRAIPEALDRLSPGGRVVVLAYQSLEDRIVKRVFAAGARPEVPHGLPVVPDSARPTLRLLTRGAEPASADEIARNPRAASVRLRAVERIAA